MKSLTLMDLHSYKEAIMRALLILILLIPVFCFAQTMVGQWTFDNTTDLLNAAVGNDLTLTGTHAAVAGPTALDGAVNIGVGSYYSANHGIPANGGGAGTWVNEYSLVIDFQVPSIGQWYTFFQTSYQNSNDGDGFINTSGQIGVAATGYSAYTVTPGQWYRLVIAADLGTSYKYYLDGQLLQDGGVQAADGRFALYPANVTQPLLFFADNDGEDNPLNVAYCAVYDGCLTAAQSAALGGYGHSILPPSAEMLPYLQTPTPTSMIVCWHGAGGDESRVEYGTTAALGSSQTGSVYTFNATTKWHSVQLIDLTPDTEYFYRCHTGTQASTVNSFRTPPALGSRQGHFRFLIMSDSQSNPGVSANVVNHVNTKLTELYGTDWQNEVQLLCHTGDMLGNGANLASYITEHFIPFSPLSAKIPIMEAIGNHEAESSYYYNYRKYEDFAGAEGEKYYSFDLGTMRFLFLNPNINTTTETAWLQNKLSQTNAMPELDWIFTFTHMPAWSEIWPDGNNTWAQNTLIPSLSAYPKAGILASGHSHNYERGVSPTGKLTTLICGGAGGALDRWGMYANQEDYPNTLKALDMYHWVLVDVDLETRSYTAKMYSLGNPSLVRNNEVMDEWDFDGNTPPLEAPDPIDQAAAVGGQMRLVAGQDYWMDEPLSTRFQVATDASFTNLLADATRHYTNVYGDTSSPLWIPTDLNAGLDIFRYGVATGVLTEGNIYYWRVSIRTMNLQWGPWSQPTEFAMWYSQPAADFINYNPYIYVGDTVQFIETSVGEATSFAWDFETDGTIDSTERDPVWIFTQDIQYNVTLTVLINGQSYSVTHPVLIHTVHNEDESVNSSACQLSVYPNPFASTANISLTLSKAQSVTVNIYNLKGELVRRFDPQNISKGSHEVLWDGKLDNGLTAPTGMYIIRVRADGQSLTRKIMYIK